MAAPKLSARERVIALASAPLTYVLAFALIGAALIVAGIGVLVGTGFALVAAGVFLLAAAWFVSSGMSGGHTSGGMTNG